MPCNKNMEVTLVLLHCTLLVSAWPVGNNVLMYCHEEETNWLFLIFRGFSSDHNPQTMNGINIQFFIHRSKFWNKFVVIMPWESKEITIITFPYICPNNICVQGDEVDFHTENWRFVLVQKTALSWLYIVIMLLPVSLMFLSVW